MVTSSAACERQDLRLGWLLASGLLHASVIAMVAHVRSSLLQAEPLTPTLLVGSSFEVLVEDAGPAPATPALEPAAPPPGRALPDPAAVATPRMDAPPRARPASPKAPIETPPSSGDPELPQDGSIAPAPRRSATSASDLQKTGSAASPGGTVDYGQQGKEGAPAQLRRAFIKMLPLAAKLDPSWLSLPATSLGRGRFVLRLNEQGQLTSVEERSGDAHPALVRAMQRNRAFLGMRRFATVGGAAEQRIVVEVSGQVSKKSPQMAAEDKVIALGVRVDPSDPQAEPRGAYFTYDSGQHVEFVWTLVNER